MKTKKLLFILNPRAGRNKPHGPLFDALAILSGAGYLIRIHETSAPGDAADTAARAPDTIWWWQPEETAPSTR